MSAGRVRDRLSKLRDAEIRAKNLQAARWGLRGLGWDLLRPQAPDPVFVIGCSRAGTTVTYETLASAGVWRVFGYEIPQFWNGLYGPLNNGWDSEAASADAARPAHRRALFRYVYQRLGRGQLLDKTCINTLRVAYLDALFPQARFVFIHRDGRDNVSSMIDGWRYGRRDGGFGLRRYFGPAPRPVAINGGEFDQWHFFLPPGWREYCEAPLETVCAYQWLTCNRLALEAARSIPDERWIELRFEDLFERPVDMFAEVFERLGVVFSAALRRRCARLGEHPTSVVRGGPGRGKWRGENRALIERVLPQLQPMQRLLGYDDGA